MSSDSSTRARALEHARVDGDLLARPHAQPIADAHVRERHVELEPVRRARAAPSSARVRGSARSASPVRPRARSSSTCPSSTSVTITAAASKYSAIAPPCAAERVGEGPRREHRDDAVQPGDAGAERDQREHVELPGAQRARAAREERPAAVQHDRRREHELEPPSSTGDTACCSGAPGSISDMASANSGTVSSAPMREPPRHVAQLGALGVVERRPRAARAPCRRSGTIPGPTLPNLGVHRAGVDRVGCGGGRRRLRREVALGLGLELREAARVAEAVGAPVVLAVVRSVGPDVMPQTGSTNPVSATHASSSFRNAPQPGQRWIAGSAFGDSRVCSAAQAGQCPRTSRISRSSR